ncbi:hypothetical protein ACWCQV_43765, partial [Streptomyces eurythermus]
PRPGLARVRGPGRHRGGRALRHPAQPAVRRAGGLAQRTTGTALVLLALSWLPLAFTRQSLWALAAGTVLLDFAVQAVHVTNQTLIHAVRPDAGSRIIGGYMIFYSAGSALGATGSSLAYATAGWTGVSALGAAFSCAALLLWATTRTP